VARDTAKHPTQGSPLQQGMIGPQMSIAPVLRNPLLPTEGLR